MDRLSDSSTRLLVKAARKIRIRLYIDRHDYRQTVFLAGTARSGTTWVQELLNYDDYYRSIFEPLHPRLAEKYGFEPVQYLPPESQDSALTRPLAKTLAGRVRHTWTDKFNRKVWVRQRLIKCVHANLLLKWIKVDYPEIPLVLIIRHPCAVANSRLKLGYLAPIRQFLAQEPLMTDYLAPFTDLLEQSGDHFEQLVLAWCIEHYVPLRQFDRGEFFLIHYEQLVSDPESVLPELCTFIGRPYSPEMLNAVLRPSALTKKYSAILTGENLVENWRREIQPGQVDWTMETLTAFGLDHLYGPDGWPRKQD